MDFFVIRILFQFKSYSGHRPCVDPQHYFKQRRHRDSVEFRRTAATKRCTKYKQPKQTINLEDMKILNVWHLRLTQNTGACDLYKYVP